MKRFYVFCGDVQWKIDAHKSDILNGLLCFFDEHNRLTSAFNADKWDVVKAMDNVE